MALMDAIERKIRLDMANRKKTYPTSKGELKDTARGPKMIETKPVLPKPKPPEGVSPSVKILKDRQDQQRKAAKMGVGKASRGY